MTLSLSISEKQYSLYAGCSAENIITSPLQPFSDLALSFLSELSSKLLTDRKARQYPDVISFAFWCRRASLNQKREQLRLHPYSIGRGLAFHVAPSNVPVNFAFSFAFGLLSGNSNLVRVPGIKHDQTRMILKNLNILFHDSKYRELENRNTFVYFERNEKINRTLSLQSDCRLIWGGDQTVSYFKSLPTKARNVDLCFADRYSITLLGSKKILSLNHSELQELCTNFYNDNFLFHQFACSSSHLINWQGSMEDICIAREKFWSEMNVLANVRGNMSDTEHIDRFARAGNLAFQEENFILSSNKSDAIYRFDLDKHEANFESYRIGYGTFSEIKNISYRTLAYNVTSRYQTVTYFGVDPSELAKNLINEGVKGVDRIVPVGSALNIDLIWDGYDIIRTLSRIMQVK